MTSHVTLKGMREENLCNVIRAVLARCCLFHNMRGYFVLFFFNSGRQSVIIKIFELRAEIWNKVLLKITQHLSASKHSIDIMCHNLLTVACFLVVHAQAYTLSVTYCISALLVCMTYRIMLNADAFQSCLSWRGLKQGFIFHMAFASCVDFLWCSLRRLLPLQSVLKTVHPKLFFWD